MKMKKQVPMNWSKNKVYDLISLYQNEPCLWNNSIEEYKSREKRDAAITKISNQLSVNREQFSKKIHNLRNQFNYEAKKVFKRNVDCKDAYKSKWEFYESLKFLKNVIAPRPGFSTSGFDDISYVTVEVRKEEICPPPEKKYSRKKSPEFTEIEEISLQNDEQIEQIFTEMTTAKTDSPKQRFQISNANEFTEEDPVPAKQRKLNNSICDNAKMTSPHNASARNEYEIFGEFVGSELKNLRCDSSRRLLKRKIMQAILEVIDKDDK